MTTATILLIILSLIVAAAASWFQYYYRTTTSSITKWLAILRGIAIFLLLLLLIIPTIVRHDYETIKTPLALVVDNSQSIKYLKADATSKEVFDKISGNSALKEKFDIQTYKIDNALENAEIFDYKGKQSDLEQVGKTLSAINHNQKYPTVLITDGNQTTGNDYTFSFDKGISVFPVVMGDTTTFLDLRVDRVNVNKYAFQKNKFPVEVFLNYSGTKSVIADFTISQGNNVLVKQSVNFSPTNRSAVINALLPAEKIGLQIYRASIRSSETEKNTYNNSKNFAVDIIDERSEIGIVSAINHPDISALKRAIETNAQRKVTILKPSETAALNKFNVLILYQPTAEFKNVYDLVTNMGTNNFTITGKNTDFRFLNDRQQSFTFNMSNQSEDYSAVFNDGFNLFAAEDIEFSSFPPLQNQFGTVTAINVSTLLSAKIRNVDVKAPLLALTATNGKRAAYLFGENIWRWRLQSHFDTKSFLKFDTFIDKIIQFLATNDSKKSLVVNHERIYNAGEAIQISAQFFNKNYEFDERARLQIAVVNKQSKQQKKYDLLKSSNDFKVNLDGLSAGQYTFKITELNSNTVYNGYFEILDFDIENQFVNPDVAKLKQVAQQTNGSVFMPEQTDALIKNLLDNKDYRAVQKEIRTKTPLIDWIWLLIMAVAAFTAEWFVRKYNGML